MKKASKHAIRTAIRAHHWIYSTCNLVPKNQYRMSIPLVNVRYRRANDHEIAEFNQRAKVVVDRLVTQFPEIKGHIEVKYHVGAWMYMSLRISNSVLEK